MNSWSGVISKRLVEWEDGPDGGAVLLIPRFRGRLLAKWVGPRLKRKHFRLKLDEIGSFVWRRIILGEEFDVIAHAMKNQFGEKADPVEERLSKFLTMLKRGKFIELYSQARMNEVSS